MPISLAKKASNLRRTANRHLNLINNNMSKLSGETLKKAEQNRDVLKQAINNSYADKKTSKVSLESVEKLKNAINDVIDINKGAEELSKTANKRLNKMFTYSTTKFAGTVKNPIYYKDLSYDEQAIKKLGRVERSFIYKQTEALWRGEKDIEHRDEIIIEKLSGIRLESGRHISNMEDVRQFLKEKYPDEYPTIDMINSKFRNYEGEIISEDSNKDIIASSASRWRSMGASI